ncbi:MAG TPA: protoheme IX farnesyltransferase [Elusimicrobia bacterium]|nr:protoheme IX farnesyltransferase [Elusimicrobiota bacterium]
MTGALRAAAGLVKPRLSAFAALATLSAYAAAGGAFSPRAAPLLLGVFLLACGASALNELQERGPDGRMTRTKERPIPAGRLSPKAAALAAAALLAAGGLCVLWAGGRAAFFLGLFAAAWYNGVYTPLKRTTPFAAVVGSLSGALPPAIGWTAAAQPLFDPRLSALCFFFCLWQIPHFWLLVPEHGGDSERAGLPALTGILDLGSVTRLICVWMSVAAASCLLLPLFGTVSSAAGSAGLAAAASWLTWKAARLLCCDRSPLSYRAAFADTNAFALSVMALVALDRCCAL